MCERPKVAESNMLSTGTKFADKNLLARAALNVYKNFQTYPSPVLNGLVVVPDGFTVEVLGVVS